MLGACRPAERWAWFGLYLVGSVLLTAKFIPTAGTMMDVLKNPAWVSVSLVLCGLPFVGIPVAIKTRGVVLLSWSAAAALAAWVFYSVKSDESSTAGIGLLGLFIFGPMVTVLGALIDQSVRTRR